jgi:hypothetical protein
VSTDEELQRDVTRAALRALDGTPFALAGSGAIREHGIIDRPTQDIDLFTSDLDASHFDTAVGSVVDELRSTGHMVDELRRAEQFARLHVTTAEGRFVEIDMGVDSREGDPVTLSVGPVLSLDDAVGNKVSALYSRAEARDYLDVDSIRASGKFTDAELIAAARDRDLGFEVPMFTTQLDGAQRLRPEQVARYGVEPAQLDAIKERFGTWAAELRAPATTAEQPGAAQQLDPELQRMVDLNKLDYPTSATEIRPPSTDRTEGRGYRPPTGQDRSNDHGYGR